MALSESNYFQVAGEHENVRSPWTAASSNRTVPVGFIQYPASGAFKPQVLKAVQSLATSVQILPLQGCPHAVASGSDVVREWSSGALPPTIRNHAQ